MPLDFNQSPYFDDYNEADKYLKVLFRPGFPVQTRELNQLQSMLQKQVDRFGSGIYENGSRVVGGVPKFDKDYHYIKIDGLDSSSDDTYLDKKIADANNVEAKIVDIARAGDGDPTTLYVKYLRSGDNQKSTFQPNTTLTITLDSGTEDVDVENASDAVGKGAAVRVQEGVYYIDGFFHLVSEQTLIVSKYTNTDEQAEISVGLLLSDSFVTEQEDPDLRSNALGTTNFSAPGAHRYKADLALVNRADITTLQEENYSEIMNIQNGVVAKEARQTDLSVIEETLARRTYDESGDYVVKDYSLSVKEHLRSPSTPAGAFSSDDGGDASKLIYKVGPGKAYVRGFEIETTVPTNLAGNKSRSTETSTDLLVPAQLGNFVYVENVHKIPAFLTEIGLYEEASVTDGVEPATKIGTAVVKNFVHDAASGKHLLYLFNIQMDTGENFATVKSFYQSDDSFTSELAVESENGVGDSVIGRSSEKSPVYLLPFGSIESVTANTLSYYSEFNATISSEEVILNVSAGSQFRDETSDYLLETESGVVGFPAAVDVDLGSGNTQTTLDVSNLTGSGDAANGENLKVIARLLKTNPSIRSKTPSTKNVTVSPANIMTLDRADAYRLNSVVGDTSGTDFTNRFRLDTGQKDTFYDYGKVIIKETETLPGGEDLVINYDFYSHGAGDFFTVESYTNSGVDYAEVPLFTNSLGETIDLKNVIDIRPSVSNTGTGFQSATHLEPDSEITSDIEYYLSRRDILCLDKEGSFSIVEGVPSLSPALPKQPENSIVLYQISVPAYTFKASDVFLEKKDQRRFTMKDIRELESRMSTLEKDVELNFLEIYALLKEFPDKFKSGFITDNFEDQKNMDSKNPVNKIAVDFKNRLARPLASTKEVPLSFDAGLSDAVEVNNTVLTLPYTEADYITQPYASRKTRINPFLTFGWYGMLKLEPSSDTWVSTERRPDLTRDNGTMETVAFQESKDSLGTIWNSWETVWTGEQSERTVEESPNFNIVETSFTERQTRTGTKTSATTRTETKFVGDKLVSVSAVPYVRSKTLMFTGQGFKPSTRLYAFFDGVDVSDYCTPTGGAQGDSLETDAEGDITGTFEIPNEETIRFETGNLTFKLTDSAKGTRGQTYANALYTATGTLKEQQREYISTKIQDVETSTVSDSRTKTITDREKVAVENQPPAEPEPEYVEVLRSRRRRGALVGYTTSLTHDDDTFTVPYLTGLDGEPDGNKIELVINFHGLESPFTDIIYYQTEKYLENDYIPAIGSQIQVKLRDPDSNVVYDSGILTFTLESLKDPEVYFSYTLSDPSEAGEYTVEVTSPNEAVGYDVKAFYKESYVSKQTKNCYTDPIAQSFIVDTEGGIHLTGIDVYLSDDIEADITLRCQIRNMVNGYPGPEVVPGTDVLLSSGDLSGSTDATTATRINFDYPVYIEQGKEHCVVLQSNSETLSAWISKLGDQSLPDVALDVEEYFISRQPYLGSLFKSQNNQTWVASSDEDLKFKLYRAVFDTDTSYDAVFTNFVSATEQDRESDPYSRTLEWRPFETTNGSNMVKVHHKNHSFRAGDPVTFENNITQATDFNGIPVAELLGIQLTVMDSGSGTPVAPDYYWVQSSTNATADGRVGGGVTTATQFVGYSTAYWMADHIETPGTKVSWGFKGFNRNSNAMDASFINVPINETVEYTDSMRVSKQSGDDTLQLRAVLSSNKDTLSPVIDLERLSGLLTESKIDNQQDTNNDPEGYNAACRYISRKAELLNPANQLKVFLDVNRPPKTNVDVFYKTARQEDEGVFEENDWVLATIDEAKSVDEDKKRFKEYEYTIDTTDDFSIFAIKVVLRSTDKSRVPRLKAARTIALKNVAAL